jgi:putative SOS response-associated peptidase YedK
MMRWGFKLPDRLLFNVRSEGVTAAKFWKDKFTEHRCIVPASSYFEWQECDTKPKPKYEIELFDREYFGIAAVWAPWKNPKTGQWEKTFATFTSEPNALIEKIHIRQPIVIDAQDFEEWLQPSARPAAYLLRVLSEDDMKMSLLAPPAQPEPKQKKKSNEPSMPGLFG